MNPSPKFPSSSSGWNPDPTLPLGPLCPFEPPTTLEAPSDTPAPRRPIVLIPGYEILDELGRGGMGVVFKAKQRALGRDVALKVIRSDGLSTELERLRFQQEAEAVAKLRHPHIISIYDIGESSEYLYIAFELLEGGTLRDWQKGRPLPAEHAARLLLPLARAIHHAHEQGVLHRDIKPANVLLSPCPRNSSSAYSPEKHGLPIPKIGDFGLAKQLQGGSQLTQTGQTCGTPNYMAPEQIEDGRTALAPTLDVYGLGALLYEMLTGVAPYSGMSAAEIFTRILTRPPTPITHFRPDLPQDLVVIAEKCLAQEPSRRYPTAAELADDLERFLRLEPIQARPLNFVERTTRWCRRNPVAAMLILVLSLGFLGMGLLSFLLSRSVQAERVARTLAENAEQTAVQEREKALSAKREAEQSHQEARKAEVDAKQERERALLLQQATEANFNLARRAFTAGLLRYAKLPPVQNDEDIVQRQNLLRSAKPFFKVFLDQKPNDPGLLSELAQTELAISYLEYTVGQYDEALRHSQEAVSLGRTLVARFPQNSEYRQNLARALHMLASDHLKLNEPQKAEAAEIESRELYRFALEENPMDVIPAVETLRILSARHQRQYLQRQWQESLETADEARRLAANILCTHGSNLEFLEHYSYATHSYGLSLQKTGRITAAEDCFCEAIALRRKLLERGPPEESHLRRLDLCLALSNLGLLLAQQQQSAEAKKCFAEAVQHSQQIAMKLPSVLDHQVSYARNLSMLGRMQRQTNETEEALEHMNQSVAILQKVLTVESRPATIRNAASDIYSARADFLEAFGCNDDAGDDWEQAEKFTLDPTRKLRYGINKITCWMKGGKPVQALAAFKKLGKLSNPEATVLMDLARFWAVRAKLENEPAHLEQAITQAEAAEAKGFFKVPGNTRRFQEHEDFAELRQRWQPKLR